MEKIKKVIKSIFGTSNNLHMKTLITLLSTSMIFIMLGAMVTEERNPQMYLTFLVTGAVLFSIFIIVIDGPDTANAIIFEIIRFFLASVGLIFSLNFYVNDSMIMTGWKATVICLLLMPVLLASMFYWISKALDILKALKKIFMEIKNRLFDENGSSRNKTEKIQKMLENATAFILTLVGFSVAVNQIMEPLINFINK